MTMMFATPTAPTSNETAPRPRNRPFRAPCAAARAWSVADGWNERTAVNGRAGGSRFRHLLDRPDAGDHRRSGQRQLGGVTEEGLTVRDGQQVRPEPVDLGEQPGLRGGGEAEHGDDRSNAD